MDSTISLCSVSGIGGVAWRYRRSWAEVCTVGRLSVLEVYCDKKWAHS